MPPTAHQLQVTPAGRLAEEDELDATLGVIQVMAGTTSTHWPHAPWFGLYERFAEAGRQQKRDHETLRDAINAALGELGVDRFRIATMTAAESPEGGPKRFDVVMEDQAGQSYFATVRMP